MNPLYVVTGADRTHARSLLQLLHTLRVWAPWTRIVVYDLGLTREQRDAVLGCGVNGSLETFPWDSYPAFFDITKDAGQYAWKPAIIGLELQKSNSPMCWMDAGNIQYRPLWGIRRALRRDGYYLPASAGAVKDWTHPLMLERLGLPPNFCAESENLNGACLAFDPLHPKARQVIEQWIRLSRERDIIAPPGSSRDNHRQDQALLTVLAYRAGLIKAPSRRIGGTGTHHDLPEAE